jgi:type I restriction enzyme, S subunit
MEVRAGYQLTQLGVIPAEWSVLPLKQISPSQSVGLVINPSTYIDSRGTVPMLLGSDVQPNKIDFENSRKITESSNRKIPASKLNAGDLVMVRVGEPGITAVIPQEFDGCNCASMMIVRKGANFDSNWLCQLMNSDLGLSQVYGAQYGTAQKQFNISDAVNFLYPTPTLAEQRAIATALSDVDALIAGLEKMIAKKRDLKQAAMQQLLTGQTRLPGFSGDWEPKTLGSIFEITAGKSKSAYVIEGGSFVICDMGSVSTDGRLITTKRTNYRADFLAKGDLVMPKDDIGGGKIIGRVGYVDASKKYVLGDHVYRLHACKGDPLFFSYLINHNSINSTLRKKVIGSAQLGLGRRSVEEQEIPFPSPVEQTAIACVLFEIDRALMVLEFRLAKTRDLKQGMMQELLTGKTRLV